MSLSIQSNLASNSRCRSFYKLICSFLSIKFPVAFRASYFTIVSSKFLVTLWSSSADFSMSVILISYFDCSSMSLVSCFCWCCRSDLVAATFVRDVSFLCQGPRLFHSVYFRRLLDRKWSPNWPESLWCPDECIILSIVLQALNWFLFLHGAGSLDWYYFWSTVFGWVFLASLCQSKTVRCSWDWFPYPFDPARRSTTLDLIAQLFRQISFWCCWTNSSADLDNFPICKLQNIVNILFLWRNILTWSKFWLFQYAVYCFPIKYSAIYLCYRL